MISLKSTFFHSGNESLPDSWNFICFRIRTQLLLVVFPLILVAIWSYIDQRLPKIGVPGAPMGVLILMLLAAIILFPYLVKLVWNNQSIQDHALSDQLSQSGERYQLQRHQFRYWDTGNQLINAAVVGFVPGHRMVYLTDALISHFPKQQTLAIVRHELGHIAQHHIPWRLFFLTGPSFLIAFAFQYLHGNWQVQFTSRLFSESHLFTLPILPVLIALPIFLWMIWLNRRFSHKIEYEADLFAVLNPVTQQVCDQARKDMIDALYRFAAHLPESYHRATYFHPSLEARIELLNRVHRQPAVVKQFQQELSQFKLASAGFLFGMGVLLLFCWSIQA